MAAQGVERYRKGPITEPLRDYMLDSTASLPPSIRFYYWFYPYREEVLLRDAGRMRISDGTTTVLWLLKFFPVAFMVTFDEQGRIDYDLARLDQFGSRHIDFEVDIPVRLRPVVHPMWPEAPDDDGALMFGEQAVYSRPVSGAMMKS
jgi:hypothetical protein